VLVPILVGVGMFIFSGKISNRLLRGIEGQENIIQAAPYLEATAFSVLGAYLLFRAIADATYLFSKFIFYSKVILTDPIYSGPPILPDDFARFVTTGVEFMLALFLLFGARGLVRLKDVIRGRE
jgi:hypothetical protein